MLLYVSKKAVLTREKIEKKILWLDKKAVLTREKTKLIFS